MSDRLAISATFSVLMMSLYVLFGAEAARVPFTPEELRRPAALSAPLPLADTAISQEGRLHRLFD